MPFWIIVSSGRGQWKYITPDGPCWKGEISVSFWFFNIVFGWQANLKASVVSRERSESVPRMG